MNLQLNWDLEILLKAIAYQNLSQAAGHIGMSQPQISRIITKLEDVYGLALIDRSSKRNSAWTKHAHKLAEAYSETTKQFKTKVETITEIEELSTIRIATLDGLLAEAIEFSQKLFLSSQCSLLELIVGDLGYLEDRYFENSIEFLISSREPGNRKLTRSKIVGYQSLDTIGSDSSHRVLSLFEYNSLNIKDTKRQPRCFVSNSLEARRRWLQTSKGTGVLPSPVRRKPTKASKEVAVYFIGLDHLSQSLWERGVKSITPGLK